MKTVIIPEPLVPTFSHASSELEEEFSIRYVARAHLPNRGDESSDILSQHPLKIVSEAFEYVIFCFCLMIFLYYS
jgi:hypothetical protein